MFSELKIQYWLKVSFVGLKQEKPNMPVEGYNLIQGSKDFLVRGASRLATLQQ